MNIKVKGALKSSYARELKAIQQTIEKERWKNRVAIGREVYTITRQDCADFINGPPEARLRFAAETGLIIQDECRKRK